MADARLDTRTAAERIAGTLPPLLVAAQRVASTVMHGMHGRRRAGTGETFWQFRRYQPGDPAALIDWRQSAKTDPLYVREREWEAAQSVWLWADASPSMRYRSHRRLPTKLDHTQLVLLAIATLISRGGEQIAWLGSGRRPGRGEERLKRVVDTCLDAASGEAIPPQTDLPRHAQLVIVSDFLQPLEAWRAIIAWYAGAGVTGHLVQILDPAEESLPFEGRARFVGLEDEGSALIGRVESVRDQYRSRLDAHRAALGDMATRVGWTLLGHHTDRPVELAVTTLYRSLSDQLGRRT